MSDSEGDSDSSVEQGDKVKKAINTCLNMKPEYTSAPKKKSIKKLKAKLNEGKNLKYIMSRKSDNVDNKKRLDECFGDLSLDLKNYIDKKFEIFSGVIAELLDRVDCLESKLSSLQCDSSRVNDPKTFAQSIKTNISSEDASDRIERLEFATSEQERDKRQLQVLITHPDLNPSVEDLAGHVKKFMTDKMGISQRELDLSLQARKVKRASTVLVIFTKKIFRNFLYSARKSLRSVNNPVCDNLFLNDNLTNLNFSILRKLRTERTRRRNEGLPNFFSVFTFEGKVFTKLTESSPKYCVRDLTEVNNFLRKLDNQNLSENAVNTINLSVV